MLQKTLSRNRYNVLILCVLVSLLSSVSAETIEHRGAKFWVYRLNPAKQNLQIFLPEKAGQPNTFKTLEQRLQKDGKQLRFALNSGIFLRTESGAFLPEGLHISNGKTEVGLNLKDFVKKYEGQFTDNFYLKPNGVFYIRKDNTAAVMESVAFSKSGETPKLATQSGPMLLGAGKIHPVLTSDSKSALLRNGVGVDKDGTIIFVSSDRTPNKGRINLYGFAELFREKLNCQNALYLDGDISDIYIRGLTGPLPNTNWFAGIIAVTEPKK